ncbi:DUF5074 domain-containing protein [Hugenholtzia roseola]|uniref:DUF5074 domain-containing protein n=1 Tax=Hugenholtzia roseola TaxID=1002 RepID=UPI0004144423|nr:DUF5074 domain-containing protein [Hugenholtzia roseola]
MMKKKYPFSLSNLFSWASFFLLTLLFSCIEESLPPQPIEPDAGSGRYEKGVFVVCEGNFGWGVATVSFLDDKEEKVFNNIFSKANQGDLLGNVAQSMVLHQNRGYVVVNNSQKIEVVEPNTFKRIATFEGFVSPRFLLPIDARKAYLTNIFRNFFYVIDLESGAILKTIEVGFWTENLLQVGEQVWVGAHEADKIAIFETENDMPIKFLTVGKGAKWWAKDAQNRVWLLTKGALAGENGQAELVCIDSRTFEIRAIKKFEAGDRVSQLAIDAQQETLFYIQNQNLISLNINDLTENVLVENLPATLVYNLEAHPKEPFLYLADALDYVQEGLVWKYDSRSGELLGRYSVGVIPQDFCFQP